MSDIMLLGVLRMSLPDDPAEVDPLMWHQLKGRIQEAATRIERDASLIDELGRVIEKRNEQDLDAEIRFTAHMQAMEAMQRERDGLEADMREERDRVARMRVEHDEEVSDLLEKVKHAEDVIAKAVENEAEKASLFARAKHAEDCLEAAKARIDELENEVFSLRVIGKNRPAQHEVQPPMDWDEQARRCQRPAAAVATHPAQEPQPDARNNGAI